MMSPNPAQMLGASFVFYTGDAADMAAIGPELELHVDNATNLELTRCLIISPQVYSVLEQRFCAGPTGRRGFGGGA